MLQLKSIRFESIASLKRWITNDIRRKVQFGLGGIWLIDGLLQLQPYMFTKQFATDTLQGVGAGQPGFVESSVNAIANFVEPHIVLWNALFAAIQLFIGVAILTKRFLKVGLVASFIWTFGVWWFGEAFGQMLNGSANLLSGAPGAVLLYGLVGIAVWPPKSTREINQKSFVIAEVSPIGEFGMKLVWSILWAVNAVLQVLPTSISSDSIKAKISGMASGEPGFIASTDSFIAKLFGNSGTEVSIVMAVVELFIAFSIFTKFKNKTLVCASIFMALVWIFVQNFGGVLTGQGTDPNSGPLYILIALTIYSFKNVKSTNSAEQNSIYGSQIEDKSMLKS